MIPKFRAYIKRGHVLNKNKIVDVLGIDFEEEEIVFKTKSSDKVKWVAKFKSIELLQFTGLKDLNGTEIYEGDIVKGQHPVDFEKRPFIGRVFYWDGAWYHGFHNDRPPKRMWEYVEVIGNIYENPELLEGE